MLNNTIEYTDGHEDRDEDYEQLDHDHYMSAAMRMRTSEYCGGIDGIPCRCRSANLMGPANHQHGGDDDNRDVDEEAWRMRRRRSRRRRETKHKALNPQTRKHCTVPQCPMKRDTPRAQTQKKHSFRPTAVNTKLTRPQARTLHPQNASNPELQNGPTKNTQLTQP